MTPIGEKNIKVIPITKDILNYAKRRFGGLRKSEKFEEAFLEFNLEKIKSILAILVLFCVCSTISFTILLGPAYVLAKIEIPAWIVIIFLVIYVISVGYFVDKYKITEKMYWNPRRRIEKRFNSTED